MTMKKSGAQGRPTYQIFDAASYAINGLTKNEVLELKDAFDLLDPQFTGKIDANQFRMLIKTYCQEKKCLSLQLALDQLLQSKKSIDFQGFLSVFTAFYHGGKTKQNYAKIFKLFDDERIGCISAKNLKRVVKELDMKIDDYQIQEMIARANLANTGVITEDEFYHIMTKIAPNL